MPPYNVTSTATWEWLVDSPSPDYAVALVRWLLSQMAPPGSPEPGDPELIAGPHLTLSVEDVTEDDGEDEDDQDEDEDEDEDDEDDEDEDDQDVSDSSDVLPGLPDLTHLLPWRRRTPSRN